MDRPESDQYRHAILTLCKQGREQEALSLLGRYLLQVAQARGVPLEPSRLSLADLFAPGNLTPDRLEALWQWLWGLIPELPARMRTQVVSDLEPAALSPDLPLHLFLDVFLASTMREKPREAEALFGRIAAVDSVAEAHALFQRLMMALEQRMTGGRASIFTAAHACFGALVDKASAAGIRDADASPARSGGPDAVPERIAIAIDAMSDARGHGPTRMALNYAKLLTCAGATVRIFETRDRSVAADQGRFNPSAPGFAPFDPVSFPVADIWRPAMDQPRLGVLRDTVGAIDEFAPHLLLRIGAGRSVAAAQTLWPVPVFAIGASSYWPGEFDAARILIKGADRVRQGFDDLAELAGRLVEHRHFIPTPRLGPAREPIREVYAKAGVPEDKRILGTAGWNAVHAIDSAFAEMMARVLDAAPDCVWAIIARELPPPVTAMKAAGYPVFHVPPVDRINRVLAVLTAFAAPFEMTGGAGGQMRAVHHGCPVVALAHPLSDSARLFLGDTAFGTPADYERHLLALLGDEEKRRALLDRQRALLRAAQTGATLDDGEALAPAGRAFLQELARLSAENAPYPAA
mgnify:CR=1 FL=1|jgi:hypothetical protein